MCNLPSVIFITAICESNLHPFFKSGSMSSKNFGYMPQNKLKLGLKIESRNLVIVCDIL